MRILYLNEHFDAYDVYATTDTLEHRKFNPPYHDLVELIQPNIVIRESKPLGGGLVSNCHIKALGDDFYFLIEGGIVEPMARPLSKEDTLVFISLAHAFEVLYMGVIDLFKALRKSNAKIEFWQERVNWDFVNRSEYVYAQFNMLKSMNRYVNNSVAARDKWWLSKKK